MKTVVFVTCLSLAALAFVACAPPAAPPAVTPFPRTATPIPPTPTAGSPTITPIPYQIPPDAPPPPLPVEARGSIAHESFRSPSLAGNLLEIATTRTFRVYLPAGYNTSSKRYPVLYALPLWTTGNASDFDIPDALGRWVQAGKMSEAIIVDVDSHSTHYVGDFFKGNPVIGDWEGYLANDLVAYIDGKYRTLPKPESRAIVGLQDAGGASAIRMGLNRPDVFGIMATMSPGFASEPFLRDCAIKAYFTGTGHLWAPAWACLELAQALSFNFASDPSKQPFAPQPATMVDGKWQLTPEVWEKAKQIHPSNDLEVYKSQDARLKAVLIVQPAADPSMDMDDFHRFIQSMKDAGIPVDYREVITPEEWGHHFWDNDMLLDFLSKQLAFE